MDEEALFHESLSHPASERAAFLVAACAGDEALRRRVEVLLRAYENPGSFLAAPAVEPPTGSFADPGAPTADYAVAGEPGAAVGPYKLLQRIGEGGMGEVWMAEQTEPVRRQVALKLIKAGMDSKAVLARFEAERQALALMDHPNIARVLDAGTSAGRPYFVMELVKGIPITQFCDDRRVGVRDRVALVVHVCRAVQHAHQKGVIHRDLKPSNVLVALYDDRPVPKVIDFGIAKATGQQLTDKTMFTGFGAVVGTPEYMSPEQAELNQLDVDTRSDVYSLGVLLYELLTGSTPIDRERSRRSSLLELLRLVREEEPARPSTRLTGVPDLPALAARRGLEPRRLVGTVRGELDWIVMRCLEKNRDRRYQSPGALADDLERYLKDEQVLACPPSAWYRFGKFARRNKASLATAVILLASVGTGAGLALSQRQEALRERDNANTHRQRAENTARKARQAVNRYYTLVSENTLLSEPSMEPLRKQLLQEALQHYQGFAEENAADPDLKAELVAAHLRITNLIYTLGEDEDWHTPMQRAVALMEELLRGDPDLDGPGFESLRAGVFRPLATGLSTYKREEIIRTTTRACELWEELVRRRPAVAGFRNDLATLYLARTVAEDQHGEYAAAAASARRSEQLWAGLRADHPTAPHYTVGLTMALNLKANALFPAGEARECEEAERQAVELTDRLAADFPSVSAYKELQVWVYGAVTTRLESGRRHREAEERYRRTLAILDGLLARYPTVGRYRYRVAFDRASLGDLLWDAGRPADAAAEYRRAFDIGNAAGRDDSMGIGAFAWLLACCPDPQFRDPPRAVELATGLTDRFPDNGDAFLTLGVARYAAADYRGSLDALDRADRLPTAFTFNVQTVDFFRAMAHARLGDKEQARRAYDAALARIRKTRHYPPECRRFCAEAEQLLGLPPHKD